MILQNEVLGTERKTFRETECLRWDPRGKGDFRKEEASIQDRHYILHNFAQGHLDLFTISKAYLSK